MSIQCVGDVFGDDGDVFLQQFLDNNFGTLCASRVDGPYKFHLPLFVFCLNISGQ